MTSQQVIYEERFRQLARSVTRDSLGYILSTALAMFMPWMLATSAFSLASLIKNIFEWRGLKKLLKQCGMRVKKRIIIKGVVVGAITKFGTWFLCFGHDDIVKMTTKTWSFLGFAGDYIADYTKLEGLRWLQPSTRSLIQLEMLDEERDNISAVHQTSSFFQKPAEYMQKATGTYDTKELGWHAGAGDVGKQVALVGGAQLAAEKTSDLIIEKSYDTGRKAYVQQKPYAKSFRESLKRRFKFW